jgi:type I restriction enzyme S subunit
VRQIIHLTGNTHRGSARLKHVLTALISGGTPDTNNDDYWSDDDEGIAWVAIGDMSTTALVRFTEKKVTESGLASKRLKVMPPGTLIYSMYASMGHVAELAIPATINQALLGFEFVEDVEPSFAKWWLRHLQPVLLAEASSNTQDNLNADKVKNLPFPAIDLASQVCIASFLDRETARIDRLIAEKERMLALLDEKRSALISRVVTRGLNPDVSVKHSGQEWLGMIPTHWHTPQLKRTWESSDYGLSESIREDGDIAVLRMSCIIDGRIDTSKSGMITEVDKSLLLRRSDLLFNRTNSLDQIAKVGLVDFDPDEPLTFASYLVRIRANHRALPEYLVALLNSSQFLNFARKNAIPAIGQANLSPARYGEIHIPLPPLAEQEEIVAFLRQETDRVTPVHENISKSIRLLCERRAALIGSAVNGQISIDRRSHDN